MKTKFALLILSLVVMISSVYCQNPDSLEKLLFEETISVEQIDLLLNLSDELHGKNPQEALKYAKRAFMISRNNRDEIRTLNSIITLSYIYWSMSQFDSAIKYSELASLSANRLELKKEEIRALRIKGHIYFDIGLYKKSTQYFTRCLRLAEESGDKIEIGTSYSNIASIYLVENDADKALEYFMKSLNISKELKDKENIAKGYNNIATVFTNSSKPDFPKAEKYFRLALEINKSLNLKRSIGINYLNLGDVLIKQRKFDEVLGCYKVAHKVFQGIKDTLFITRLDINISQYFHEKEEYHESNKYALSACSEGIKHGYTKAIIDASNLLTQNYIKLNDTIKAFKFDVIHDSLFEQYSAKENRAELAKLMMQYDVEKADKLAKSHQEKMNTIYIISLSFAVFLGLFLWIIISLKRQMRSKQQLLEKTEMQNNIETKNKELVLNTMSQLKQNEMLMQISEEVSRLNTETNDEQMKHKIFQIAQKINICSRNEIWDEFEIRFTHVHEDFYSNLLKKYPDLTPNELRLCALLKLNMTTKEMSNLTGQSINALEMARFRIRKKIGISSTNQNLVNYLSKI